METIYDIERERRNRGEITHTMETWILQRTVNAVRGGDD
jgi:hypothetical protein